MVSRNGKDVTQWFIIRKMLTGLRRIDKRIDTRMPITLDILENILKIRELVANSIGDQGNSLQNFNIIYVSCITSLEIVIPHSKTDHSGLGYTLHVQEANMHLCPVRAVSAYMSKRPARAAKHISIMAELRSHEVVRGAIIQQALQRFTWSNIKVSPLLNESGPKLKLGHNKAIVQFVGTITTPISILSKDNVAIKINVKCFKDSSFSTKQTTTTFEETTTARETISLISPTTTDIKDNVNNQDTDISEKDIYEEPSSHTDLHCYENLVMGNTTMDRNESRNISNNRETNRTGGTGGDYTKLQLANNENKNETGTYTGLQMTPVSKYEIINIVLPLKHMCWHIWDFFLDYLSII
ncbi:hypothetical protein KUTeg_018179 [Tegillarca granosa]|uniref:Uncharacterized protein n=1 Tax=Tegillarca granosa TaxID=220873 RepID=A0ABQ9EH57_TEGGR|nr:hypothetical protein KUTeg_018179 [Tegillarca granosa]